MIRFNSKIFTISTIAVVLVLATGWVVYSAFRTYPLGDKLEYIGSYSGGNFPILSSSAPYTDYYYATDMRPEEVVRYLHSTIRETLYASDSGGLYRITTRENSKIQIEVTEKSAISDSLKRNVPQKYIVTIADYDYNAVQQSLK